MIAQAAYDSFMRFDTFIAMGWYNIIWVIVIVAVFLAAKAGKLGFIVIGPNEKGAREIFGIPVWPVFRGAHFFIVGILNIRKVPTMPTRIDIRLRVSLFDDRVIEYVGTVFVSISRKWRELKKAIYGSFDEDKKDMESPERTLQTKAILTGGARTLLKGALDENVVTKERLIEVCEPELRKRFGTVIESIITEEGEPVDMQLVKEGLLQGNMDLSMLTQPHPHYEATKGESA